MFFIRNWHFPGILPARTAMQIIAITAALAACTPAFNWREVSLDQGGVTALLPCKPDRGERAVQLAGQAAQMSMAGCESGGAMFTISIVQVPASGSIPAMAEELKAGSKATHSRQLQHGRFIAQAAIYGQPKEGHDGPGAFSSQAVETFLSNFKMSGAQ
jgi:hypothetical protein